VKQRWRLVILAIASLPLLGAGPTGQIEALLAKPKVLCGRFDQNKQLVGLKKPLISHGRFCVVADKGVLWRTLQPFASNLRLTRDEIVQLQGERVALRLDAKKEPMVRMINSVLFALLAGDLNQLEKLFEIDGSVGNGNWNVKLKARAPSLAKAIGAIELAGGAYVRQVIITESSGDRTTILFSAIETGDAAMTADEAALF
jgi:hypothetical protein